jgi:hypothetical protein
MAGVNPLLDTAGTVVEIVFIAPNTAPGAATARPNALRKVLRFILRAFFHNPVISHILSHPFLGSSPRFDFEELPAYKKPESQHFQA